MWLMKNNPSVILKNQHGTLKDGVHLLYLIHESFENNVQTYTCINIVFLQTLNIRIWRFLYYYHSLWYKCSHSELQR